LNRDHGLTFCFSMIFPKTGSHPGTGFFGIMLLRRLSSAIISIARGAVIRSF
jgi:hypothetical protein